MAGVAVGVTVIVGLFTLMLTTGEKKIEQTIARHYDADDAQFGRAMGVLLGPTNIEGNRFEVLLNGDEIFPSMLAAIRGARRKVLVVDGTVGFTGGVGIADAWAGRAQDPRHWRDTHFRAEGPVVAQMQAVFMDNWIKVTGEVLHGVEYFPALVKRGEARAQMFSSSPEGGSESMQLMYLLAITAAAKTIHLSSAYFVPDDLSLKALVAAAKRGVRIQIITPGEHMDAETVRKASRARWGDLLEAGVEIFEYQPTMYHCKVMIVDGLWLSVWSTNFDSRSFSLNDEANLNIFDPRPLPRARSRSSSRIWRDPARSRWMSGGSGRWRRKSSSIRRRCCGCSCERIANRPASSTTTSCGTPPFARNERQRTDRYTFAGYSLPVADRLSVPDAGQKTEDMHDRCRRKLRCLGQRFFLLK